MQIMGCLTHTHLSYPFRRVDKVYRSADSTLITAFKVPLFLITVPVDIVLLPAAAVAGFF